MIKYYIADLEKWCSSNIPKYINQKNFLLIVGSLFLLGIVTKWIAVHYYGKLIRKAENIDHTRNGTIRQIKTKYDSLKQVNRNVENPMVFVSRNINKCKVFHINLNRMNNIINWCSLLIMIVAAMVAFQCYTGMPKGIQWVSYTVIGIFSGLALEMVNRSMPFGEKKTELTYVLADALVNGSKRVNVAERDNLIELVPDKNNEENHENMTYSQENQEEKDEEILNQVIGEFLQ